MTFPMKTADLRARGDYFDSYSDSYSFYEGDQIVIVPTQHSPYYSESREGWVRVSSRFIYTGELEEFPDIWSAITTVWNNRGSYSFEDLRIAMDEALCAAGYSNPEGPDCVATTDRRYQLAFAELEVPDAPAPGGITVVGAGAMVSVANHAIDLTPLLPSGVEQDDAIYIVVTSRSGGQPTATSSGYTAIADVFIEIGGADLSMSVLRKMAGASETDPVVDISGTSTSGWSAYTFVLRGVSVSTPEDAAFTELTGAAASTFQGPTITTVTANAFVLSVVASADDNALDLEVGGEDGFVLEATGATGQGNDHASALASKEVVSPGATDAPTWEQTSLGPDAWVGVAIAVRPA